MFGRKKKRAEVPAPTPVAERRTKPPSLEVDVRTATDVEGSRTHHGVLVLGGEILWTGPGYTFTDAIRGGYPSWKITYDEYAQVMARDAAERHLRKALQWLLQDDYTIE